MKEYKVEVERIVKRIEILNLCTYITSFIEYI